MTRPIEIHRLGVVSYSDALDLQKHLVERRKSNEIPDQLLLLEHPPVITLGVKTRNDRSHVVATPEVLEEEGVEVFESGRGGDVTYHGPGQLVGYPIMSPEQVLGGPIDARSDVFSLGVVLYEMLTGRNPFTAATAADTVVNVIAAKIAPAHALSTSLGDLDALVLRALAKEIDQRPQSAASFSAELRGIGAILDVRAGDVAPSELLPLDDEGAPGRGRWWVAAAAILAIGGLAWWILK